MGATMPDAQERGLTFEQACAAHDASHKRWEAAVRDRDSERHAIAILALDWLDRKMPTAAFRAALRRSRAALESAIERARLEREEGARLNEVIQRGR